MSVTIEVAQPRALVYRDVIGALAIHDLRCREDAPDAGAAWPAGTRHFYRDQISTRTTEITLAGDKLAIRMFSLASREDIELAVAFAERAAALAGVHEVEAEMCGVVPVDTLREIYATTWADDQARSGVRVLRALIADGKGPIEMPGPTRAFCVGPRVLAELGPDDTAHVALIAAIRRVQWCPIRTAGEFVTRGERDHTLAFWLGDEVVFPPVEYAGVSIEHAAQRDVFLIPSERVPELAGARWQWLDERQGIIAAFGDDWPALVAAARRYQVEL